MTLKPTPTWQSQGACKGSDPDQATSFSGLGVTAEWITEDPGNPVANRPYPLADFGSTTFTDLSLAQPFSSWWLMDSDAVTMMTPQGSVEALPSPMQGASFTVSDEEA